MVRLRVSWPFSLSSAPTVGNPCRPLQPESVSCTASRKIRSFRPLAPRRERQARNSSSTVAQSSSVIRVSMVGSSQTDLPSVTDPRTWESTHRILSPIRPHSLVKRVIDYCQGRDGYGDVIALCAPRAALNVGSEVTVEGDTGETTVTKDGYVYLAVLKIGREKRYKIGKAVLVDRRI